jgi:Holliday junction DNA helicase RuvA
MIRRVRGILEYTGPGEVEVLTAGGVGYELAVPVTLLDRLPPVGGEVDLHASLVVRDDALELYGFGTTRERDLFQRLQGASGVGPRLALALVGAMPDHRLVNAIRHKDHAVLQTVSGVGRKTAERIALELADKLDDLVTEAGDLEPTAGSQAAVQALRALGYGPAESQAAVARALESLGGAPDDVPTEDLIKLALQHA